MSESPFERLRRAVVLLEPDRHDEVALAAEFPGSRFGAVLALFYPLGGQPHLVLTRRTPDLRLHSGQISLPGGRIDPEDPSPAAAALRETTEELGVDTAGLPVWGPLDVVFTMASNFLLIPFVGFLDHRPDFMPNPYEVAEVIELPLARLIDPGAVENEFWEIRGETRLVAYYRYREHKIWGATGKVLRQIVELAGGSPPSGLFLPGDVVPDLPVNQRGGA